MRQLNDRQYEAPWQTKDQKVLKIAVNYSIEKRNISWIIERAE